MDSLTHTPRTRHTASHAAGSYKKGMLAVLDIGSSKIVCMIAHSDGSTPPIIHGIGHQKTVGIARDLVTDQAALAYAIGRAVEAAERMAGVNIHSVYVGISGGRQTSLIRQHKIAIANGQVMLADIRRLLWMDFNQPPPPVTNQANLPTDGEDRTVLHRLPLAYTLDAATDISNPLGMHGNQLGVALSVVTADTGFIAAIGMAVKHNYLRVISLPVASGYASGLGALTSEERLNNASVLDIGAGGSSLVHFSRGMLMYLDSVPYGGDSITSDIAQCLGVPEAEAVRLKCTYPLVVGRGAASPSPAASPVSSSPAASPVSTSPAVPASPVSIAPASASAVSPPLASPTPDFASSPSASPDLPPPLTEIITARVEEIADLLFTRFDQAGFGRHIRPRLTLVGGTAGLGEVDTIIGGRFTAHFNTPCQITLGRPHGVIGLAEMSRTPGFASTAGLVRYGFIDYALEPTLRLRDSGPFGRIAAWVKHYIWDSAQ